MVVIMEYNQEKKNLLYFFILTFVISWLLWIPDLLVAFNIIPTGPIQIISQFAIFGPLIAAFYLTLSNQGKAEAKRLWLSGWNFRFKKIWIISLFIPIFTAGITFIIVSIIEPFDRLQYAPPIILWIPLFILYYFIGGPFAEEYGWRGYALDRLQLKFSALISSLILGLIWGLWHLPLVFIPGTTQSNIPFYEFLLLQILISVIYTWILNNNRDKDGNINVFLAMLYHAMGNFSSMILPFYVTGLGRWILFILTALIVVFILSYYGIKTLVREK
jgi:membrane protease YdiL (CAAX protease family)